VRAVLEGHERELDDGVGRRVAARRLHVDERGHSLLGLIVFRVPLVALEEREHLVLSGRPDLLHQRMDV